LDGPEAEADDVDAARLDDERSSSSGRMTDGDVGMGAKVKVAMLSRFLPSSPPRLKTTVPSPSI
jgi:hypothetical protein